jgi:hypothetical protein
MAGENRFWNAILGCILIKCFQNGIPVHSVTKIPFTITGRVVAGMKTFTYLSFNNRSWGSSVSIVSGYRLDAQAIEVRSPAGAKDFSCSLCVQTGSEAHPASCTMGTGGPFPGGKARPGRDADHSPPSSAEVENE